MSSVKTEKGRVSRNNLIVILGPTASGKTDLATKLARKFGGEIINADSRQIYCHLDIGTAKESRWRMANGKWQKIHLVDIADPVKIITAAQYKRLAEKRIGEIIKRERLPILCGGTMLYIDMVTKDYQMPQGAPNKILRKKFAKKSLKELVWQLKRIDPKAIRRVDLKNRRRVERALELALLGQSITAAKKGKSKYNILKIGIAKPREELYEKINRRVEQMIDRGLIEETKKIYKKYGDEILKQTLGYQEILSWLKTKPDKIILEDDFVRLVQQIQKNTRHYAKRQLTWWKRDKEIKWVKNYKEAENLLRHFLKNKYLDFTPLR